MIGACIRNIESKVIADAALIDCVDAASAHLDKKDVTFRIGHVYENVSVSSRMIHQCVSASLSFIKDIKPANYLKVDKDVLWVTPDILEQLMVMSNTDWVIT